MEALNVLVVDDSGIVIMKLSKIFKELGHNVVGSAKTGVQAIEQYAELNPDLVTMDITMPDMNGIEATQKILEQDENATIIMVTSHGQEQMVMDAIDAGAKGYILKPFYADKIQAHLEKIFAAED
ncbi:response regulator [Desulfovibrio sp. JC010]|uniref:response regulator n=1 Tax=Desulfovibrio sp. JC010 TaxID=2593641 RepID=UPI0013D8C2DB|nr:response regulator [Desulfovibrio sp. JC010]NDV25614.1 response regulator [Desulfovibrio sp. JC010]